MHASYHSMYFGRPSRLPSSFKLRDTDIRETVGYEWHSRGHSDAYEWPRADG